MAISGVSVANMQNPNLERGSLPHATALKFLRNVVDVAFPRLVQNGYYHPDTDTSGWPEEIYRSYYYDRDAKDLQKVMIQGYYRRCRRRSRPRCCCCSSLAAGLEKLTC
jgi:hypothetical protein